MSEFEFKPEDFNFKTKIDGLYMSTLQNELAAIANDKLKEWLDKAPIVYQHSDVEQDGFRFEDVCWSELDNIQDAVVSQIGTSEWFYKKAKLVCIEEIKEEKK